jgi:hypothetical protein
MSTLTNTVSEAEAEAPAPVEEVKELSSDSSASSDWKAVLPEDIREDPALKAIQNVDGLAKSYVHSQRMLGSDKVIIPSKYAEDHEWKSFFQKAGLPEEVKDYEVSSSEEVDGEFMDEYKKMSYENNILPNQAQKMFDWYMDKASVEVKRQEEERGHNMEQSAKTLRTDWGSSYDSKIRSAQNAILHYGNKDLNKYLDDTGIGNDPNLIRIFSKVGETLDDDSFKGDSNPGNYGRTPEQAQIEINEIMANPKHPYFDKNHPNHRKALEDMERLFTYKG